MVTVCTNVDPNIVLPFTIYDVQRLLRQEPSELGADAEAGNRRRTRASQAGRLQGRCRLHADNVTAINVDLENVEDDDLTHSPVAKTTATSIGESATARWSAGSNPALSAMLMSSCRSRLFPGELTPTAQKEVRNEVERTQAEPISRAPAPTKERPPPSSRPSRRFGAASSPACSGRTSSTSPA